MFERLSDVSKIEREDRESHSDDGLVFGVEYIDAARYEIASRMKFPLVAERYFADPGRPRLPHKLNYAEWVLGRFKNELKDYEDEADEFFSAAYKDFFVYAKESKFGVDELIESV